VLLLVRASVIAPATVNATSASDKAFTDALKKTVDKQFAERRNMNVSAPTRRMIYLACNCKAKTMS
jgi:hypothetical protein